MESDSTLSALSLAISLLILGVSRFGETVILAGLHSSELNDGNGYSADRQTLELVARIPTEPAAPFRLLALLAFAVAVASAVALAVSVWGLRWESISVGAVGSLLALGGMALIVRRLGARMYPAVWPVMLRASWLLSYPFRPILLVRAGASDIPAADHAHVPDSSLGFALSVDSDDGPLDEHEVRMIRGVVQLDKTVAREIMAPRVDIVAVESGETLDALAEIMNSAGHSRVPVYDGDLDRVEGVAMARDVLQRLSAGCDPSSVTAREVAREPLFVPESKNLEELLEEFREKRIHLAIVVDEYGGVSGIVTIEDLLEEIVGEIHDEFDTAEPVIQSVGESEFLVDSRLPIDDLNESLGIDIAPGAGFDTIGGLVFDQLGKVPVAGDSVVYEGMRIVVVNTIGRRPNILRINMATSSTR